MNHPLRRSASALVMPAVLLIASISPIERLCAQDILDVKSATHLRQEYMADLDTVHVKIMALAEAIPADKYSWRPAAGVRSVSEALMHIASEWYYYVPGSLGQKPPADFGAPKEALPKLEKITGKAEVIAELKKSWAHTKSSFATSSPAAMTGKYKPWGYPLDQAAFGMAGDLHEHLGQMITYARSVGVKPPWSK